MFVDLLLEGLVVLADAKWLFQTRAKVHSSQQGNKDYKKCNPQKLKLHLREFCHIT